MDGTCPACSARFPAALIDCDFDGSGYAYCVGCGTIAVCRPERWPGHSRPPEPGAIPPELTRLLGPCSCGGQFHTHAMPRCPACGLALDPQTATPWIEAGVPDTSEGWTWQRSWVGLYGLVIAGRVTNDPWTASAST